MTTRTHIHDINSAFGSTVILTMYWVSHQNVLNYILLILVKKLIWKVFENRF